MAWERRTMPAGSVVAVALCAVAALGACFSLLAARTSSPAELLYAGHVDMMKGADWGSTRLPDDARDHIGAALKAIDTSSAMEELSAAHFGSTRLPEDAGSEQALHTQTSMFHLSGTKAARAQSQFPVGRELAGELADNGAAALRTNSFKWAMDDCKAKNNCQSLVGKRLWRVLQTKPGKPNLHIFHDQDDDRRKEERNMEKDYLHSSRSSGEEESAVRWQKLKQMMRQHEPLRGIPKDLQAELHEIEIENIPHSQKRLLEKSLLRSHEEEQQASRDSSEYESDTSLIYGGGKRGLSRKWREYKASMVPSKRDEAAEVRDAKQDMQAHASETSVLHKMESKADKQLSSKTDKAGQHQLSGWAHQERSLLREEDKSDALQHAHASETRSQNVVRRSTRQSEVKEMQEELASYSKPFSHQLSLDQQLKQYQEQQARKTSHEKEAEAEHAMRKRAQQDAREHEKEKEMAAAELAGYDGAYNRRPIISPPGSLSPHAALLGARGRTQELADAEGGGGEKKGSSCYLASGKEVACQKLAQLGNLMKDIYGKQASDVAIVSKDNAFDPTQVLKAPPTDFPASPPAQLRQHASPHRGRRGAAQMQLAQQHTEKKVQEKRGGESKLGELIHKMNEEELKPLKTKFGSRGDFASLSHSLASVIGW